MRIEVRRRTVNIKRKLIPVLFNKGSPELPWRDKLTERQIELEASDKQQRYVKPGNYEEPHKNGGNGSICV